VAGYELSSRNYNVAATHSFGLLRSNDFDDSWGDTTHAPRPSGKEAAPPPLLLAGIHHGGGQMGSRDHEEMVAARHPFGPAPGATHPCRAASLIKSEKGFGEGTPLALPAHGLRPRDPCFSLILQGVAY
jgi:hypothetical protein